MPSHTQQLRGLLNRPGIIRTLAAHDVFTARVMEAAGIEMLFVGGFGVSASLLGQPDVGLLTLTEMRDVVARMTARVAVAVVADGDTGHGDLQNVARTVREFERAGAAGVLLEDQVAPKRCGHFEGKQVISAGEMVLKLKAALDARRDPDFVIMARTDARAVEGLDAAIDRANRYGRTGADVCFIEAPESVAELERIPQQVSFPLLANMLVGGTTPILSADRLEQLGYKIAVHPVSSLLATGFAVRRLVESLQRGGRVDQLADQMMTFESVKQLLGLDEIVNLRDRLEKSGEDKR